MATIKFRKEYPGFTDPDVSVTCVNYKDVKYLTQLPEGFQEEQVDGFWVIHDLATGVKYTSKDREKAISKVSSEVSRRHAHSETYGQAIDVVPTPED